MVTKNTLDMDYPQQIRVTLLKKFEQLLKLSDDMVSALADDTEIADE